MVQDFSHQQYVKQLVFFRWEGVYQGQDMGNQARKVHCWVNLAFLIFVGGIPTSRKNHPRNQRWWERCGFYLGGYVFLKLTAVSQFFPFFRGKLLVLQRMICLQRFQPTTNNYQLGDVNLWLKIGETSPDNWRYSTQKHPSMLQEFELQQGHCFLPHHFGNMCISF